MARKSSSCSLVDCSATVLLIELRVVGLVVIARQGQGAASQVITIANVDFDNVESDSNPGADFTGYRGNFGIANAASSPLTLTGTNKILVIEDVV